MKYDNIHPAVFLRRLNRFVAEVELNGAVERVHVKNTGRCAELLVKGNTAYLVRSDNPNRCTAYDLVAVVRQDGRLINMDSMAPNRAAGEWLAAGGLGDFQNLRAEVRVGESRFDFAATQDGRPVYIEVKGCTLEQDGVARFPDAPTERGVRHVKGLTALSEQGCRCVVLIVIQMKGVHTFEPNWLTHPAFGEALIEARQAGVEVIAMDCRIVPGMVEIDQAVTVNLER